MDDLQEFHGVDSVDKEAYSLLFHKTLIYRASKHCSLTVSVDVVYYLIEANDIFGFVVNEPIS